MLRLLVAHLVFAVLANGCRGAYQRGVLVELLWMRDSAYAVCLRETVGRFEGGDDELGTEEPSSPAEAFGPLPAYAHAETKKVEAHAIEGCPLLRGQEELKLLELLLCDVEGAKVPRFSRKVLFHVVGCLVVADACRKAAVLAVFEPELDMNHWLRLCYRVTSSWCNLSSCPIQHTPLEKLAVEREETQDNFFAHAAGRCLRQRRAYISRFQFLVGGARFLRAAELGEEEEQRQHGVAEGGKKKVVLGGPALVAHFVGHVEHGKGRHGADERRNGIDVDHLCDRPQEGQAKEDEQGQPDDRIGVGDGKRAFRDGLARV